METISENKCFGGVQGVYRHASAATGTQMTFGLFMPKQQNDRPAPVLWYLSGRYRSLSALAPFCNPTGVDWGHDKLGAYLGPDPQRWARHDAYLLMAERGFDGPVLIDTGANDEHIGMLGLTAMQTTMQGRGQATTVRFQPGYDHSYFFVASFMQDHVDFHADALFS